MKLTIISKNNMHVHVSSAVNNIHLMIKVRSCYCSGKAR